ncbi:hypothetical protein Tco_1396019, partial [Tanacetum coccineum]
MVDVPIRHEDHVVQRTSLVDTVISMVIEQSTPTPPPPTTEVQLSKVDHAEAIEEFIQANVINEVKNQLPKLLPKAVSDYVQPRMESTVRDVLRKNPINLFKPSSKPTDSSTEYELKNMLYDKIQESGSFKEHEKHLDLYNDLIGSIGLDDAIAKDETIQDVAIEIEEPVEDNVVNAEEQPQDDAAPKRDNSIWFKQDVVVRPETPDPEWHKEPNADDAPEQNWFNELVNAEKDPLTFDDLMGSTVDFTKFAKNRLKKDKITKADLEGPAFKLLKGTCRNNIELEYNLEQCYLALSDQLDWANPEGDKCPYDMSKPLPLQGPPGHLTILVDFFFNNDLEYLKTGNKERKYVASL